MSHRTEPVKPVASSNEDNKMSNLTDDVIREIWQRLQQGDHQHRIAADHDINQGRVSEINTGKRGGHITGLSAS